MNQPIKSVIDKLGPAKAKRLGEDLSRHFNKEEKPLRNEEIRCRLTQSEKSDIEAHAHELGISVSDYTRIALKKMMGGGLFTVGGA